MNETQSQIQQLLASTKQLFQTIERHTVDEVMKRRGKLMPFGVGVSKSGEYTIAGIEDPDPRKALNYAMTALQKLARDGKISFAATCFATYPEHPSMPSLMVVIIEDELGTAIHCKRHYQQTSSGWTFGDMTASLGESVVFASVRE